MKMHLPNFTMSPSGKTLLQFLTTTPQEQNYSFPKYHISDNLFFPEEKGGTNYEVSNIVWELIGQAITC